nr:methyl-accepting chemotaxis protein [Burkholderia contaminans]
MTSTVKQNADNARQANALVGQAKEATELGGAAERSSRRCGRFRTDRCGSPTSPSSSKHRVPDQHSRAQCRGGSHGPARRGAGSSSRRKSARSRNAAPRPRRTSRIDRRVGQAGSGSRLVETAGERMTEIVRSIDRVADIMGEISAASAEQSTGIEQIGLAVAQMDEVTQQNAARRAAAAAASSLDEQAARLRAAVSVFRLAA